MSIFTVEEQIETPSAMRSHIVILGAGASLAALPNGDRYGHRLPVIKNFASTLGLDELLRQHGIPEPYDDFESIYSDLKADEKRHQLCLEIERIISSYFSDLELPDEPTLYDHLVLSLRPKDIIATFNWDPFLIQAAARNHQFSEPPALLFLHGNAAICYCENCKVIFPAHPVCPGCKSTAKKSPLLYPVKNKNYQSDAAISTHWKILKEELKSAYAVTFFGYGAPRTDVEAITLLKEGWGHPDTREYEETEIIDIRDEDDLLKTWSGFIHTHHYRVRASFYDSLIAKHPRRTCEALWNQLMLCRWLTSSEFPKSADWDELYEWFSPRLEHEKKRLTKH